MKVKDGTEIHRGSSEWFTLGCEDKRSILCYRFYLSQIGESSGDIFICLRGHHLSLPVIELKGLGNHGIVPNI